MKSFSTLAALVLSAVAVAGAVKVPDGCVEGTSELLSTTTVDGKELTLHQCVPKANSEDAAAFGGSSLVRRDENLCGAPCTTYCNSGSGGPSTSDCESLASSIAGRGGFTIKSGTAIYWTLSTCQAYMNNRLSPAQTIEYCYDYSNLAGVIKYMADNCNGNSGHNGGSCHFYDDTSISWVQIQRS